MMLAESDRRADVTPEQVDIVEATMAVIEPHLDALSADFYARLFALDPTLRTLFATDAEQQREKFSAELADIASVLRRHGDFLAETTALGRPHVDYGVRPTHYRTAGIALVSALADALDTSWTSDVERAWRLAYNLTAEAMMAARSTG